jgi:uncharacterized repeat protein (TIGR03803 family)
MELTLHSSGANHEAQKSVPAGKSVTVVHSFNGNDGAGVNGPLVQGTEGNFYGTTSFGGTFDGGTIFKVDAAGNLTVLHHSAPGVVAVRTS